MAAPPLQDMCVVKNSEYSHNHTRLSSTLQLFIFNPGTLVAYDMSTTQTTPPEVRNENNRSGLDDSPPVMAIGTSGCSRRWRPALPREISGLATKGSLDTELPRRSVAGCVSSCDSRRDATRISLQAEWGRSLPWAPLLAQERSIIRTKLAQALELLLQDDLSVKSK